MTCQEKVKTGFFTSQKIVFLFWSPNCVIYMLKLLYSQGQSGDQIPVGQDFPPVQTGPGAHPASCIMGTGSFPGVKYGQGMLLTTHPLLVPQSWKSRAVPLPTLWATTGPVMGTLYLYLLLYSQDCLPVKNLVFFVLDTQLCFLNMLKLLYSQDCLPVKRLLFILDILLCYIY